MSATALTSADVDALRECVARAGVAVFPSDTVYGLGCDPGSEAAVGRLYALKGRPPARPAAVMFFALEPVLRALPELQARERAALRALLPGLLTLLLPNRRRRFALACGPDPTTLGLRVPLLGADLAALGALEVPLLQSSANISGEPAARRLADVPQRLRAGADLVLDAGELPGLASTVLDLREYERSGQWRIVREGPVGRAELERALAAR
ncbi:MAG TPA: Sua5/YciO/YrdC/YwlC family protein [Solirubrobacteraceae bacterium]|nr:Sua5/YciO/YrdC/YwlC family protein [Solirubrobacteraceae bacterium]